MSNDTIDINIVVDVLVDTQGPAIRPRGDPAAEPEPLPQDVVKVDSLEFVNTKTDLQINEYQIGDTYILVIDGRTARANGESFDAQSIEASLAIQNRVNELKDTPAFSEGAVIITGRPGEDSGLATIAATVNGINAVAFDPPPISATSLTNTHQGVLDFGAPLTARVV